MKKLNTIWMTVGLQASGKSTWARDLVSNSNGKVVNINKDDLREMLHCSIHSKGREHLVLALQEAMIDVTLAEGKDCVISDTNLNPIHIERITNKFSDRAKIVINDSFLSVSLEECIRRDALREKPVGEKAIRDTYNRWLKKEEKPIMIERCDDKLDSVIFDIDGTLTMGPKNRSPYEWSKVGQDDVNPAVRDLAHMCSQKYCVIIVSGRDAVCRPETEKWLSDNNIAYTHLFMRNENDNRPDDVVKEEIIDKMILPVYNIKMWVDDRLKVCRMIYRKGIPLFRVGNPDADF